MRRAIPSLSVVAVPFVILWFIPNSVWQARVSVMDSALNSGATRLVASEVEVQKRKIFSLAAYSQITYFPEHLLDQNC